MSITHGMNVEEVRSLGKRLQAIAGQLDTIVNQLEGQVGSTSWVGPDATAFKTQWWPEHKKNIKAASQGLQGFGQSALNNASAQETASSQ